MKKSIKIWLIAAMAAISGNVWGAFDATVIYIDLSQQPSYLTNAYVHTWNGSSDNYISLGSSTANNIYAVAINANIHGWELCHWAGNQKKDACEWIWEQQYNYFKINTTGTGGTKQSGYTPPSPGHTLTFNKTGSGSVSATVDNSPETSPVSSVEEGTTIVLTATPSSSVFTCWKVGDDIVSYDNPYTRTMPDEDLTVTAVFEADRKIDGCANCFKYE